MRHTFFPSLALMGLFAGSAEARVSKEKATITIQNLTRDTMDLQNALDGQATAKDLQKAAG